MKQTLQRILIFSASMMSSFAWAHTGATPAADDGPLETLSMREAEAVAVLRSRSLIAARLQIDDREVEKIVAEIFPNPEISYGVANVIVGRPNDQGLENFHPRMFEQAIQSIAVTQVVDLWWKRSLRSKLAVASLSEARLLVEDAIRHLRHAVQSAYAEVLREQSETALSKKTREHYQESVSLSQKRYAVGDISAGELRKVELEGLKYATAVVDAEMELALARDHLASLMSYNDAAALPATLFDPPALKALPDRQGLVAQAMTNRPDVLATHAGLRRAELLVAVAERDAYPDLTLGLSYTHSRFQISGDNPNTIGAQISIPLPLFDRNQGAVAQARVDVRRASNELELVRLAVHHEVTEALNRLQRAKTLLDIFETEMLQRAELALEVADKSYAAGASSLLETLEAQRTYIETQAHYLQTRYDWQQARIDVARACGSAVP